MSHTRPLLIASSLALFAVPLQALAQIAAPTGLDASDGTLTDGIELTWEAVDDANGYRILRRLGSTPAMVVGTALEPEFLDTSALRGRLYEYFVLALAEDEVSPPSESDTGWRNVPPPANLDASDGASPNAVIVTWSPVQGQQGYRVHRGLDAESLVEIGLSNGPNFHDTATVPGVVYTYMVTVRLEPGDSAPSELETGFRAGDPPSTVPTGLFASDGASTEGVAVSWNPVEGAEGYRVLRSLSDDVASEIAFVTETSYFDDHTVAGVLYAYSVKAVVDGVDTEASATDTGWMNVPAPSNLDASDGTDPDGVRLSWDPVEDALDYRVFRRRGNGNPNAPADEIALVAEPTFLDTGTLPGKAKVYFVRARTEPGDSAASLDDVGFRGLPAPSNVQASDGTFTDRIMVRWRPVPRSGGYRVLRTGPDGIEQEIAITHGPVLQDVNAMPGVTYAYRVATRAGGEDAPFSEPDTGWMNIPAPTGLAASDGTSIDAVLLSWNEVEGAIGYRVLRSTAGEPATPIAVVPGPPYVDASALQGVPYTYVVTARTPAGDSRASTPDQGFRNVRAPGGVSASDGTFPDRVEIVWAASSEAAVEGYVVLRQLEGEAEPTPIGEVSTESPTHFDDTTIDLGVTGTYSIRARTAAGLSAASVTDTGFRQAAPFAGGTPIPLVPTVDRQGASPEVTSESEAARGERGLDPAAGDSIAANPTKEQPREDGAKELASPSETIETSASPCERATRRGHELAETVLANDDEAAFEREAELEDRRLELEFLAAISIASEIECAIAHGDLDLDGEVDSEDLALLIESWWLGSPLLGDFDRSGEVDLDDLSAWTIADANGR